MAPAQRQPNYAAGRKLRAGVGQEQELAWSRSWLGAGVGSEERAAWLPCCLLLWLWSRRFATLYGSTRYAISVSGCCLSHSSAGSKRDNCSRRSKYSTHPLQPLLNYPPLCLPIWRANKPLTLCRISRLLSRSTATLQLCGTSYIVALSFTHSLSRSLSLLLLLLLLLFCGCCCL